MLIDAIRYLVNENNGHAPSSGWFLDNLSGLGKASVYIGWATYVIDGIDVWNQTGDFKAGLITTAYDFGGYFISYGIGGLIGTAIGGPVGAVVAIEFGWQSLKEYVVPWATDRVNAFWNLLQSLFNEKCLA